MPLEEEIEALEELDRLRKRIAKLLDDGRKSLREDLKGRPLSAAADPVDRSTRFMEDALVLRALCSSGAPSLADLLHSLESMRLDDVVGAKDQDDIPVLRAAA